MAGKRTQRAFGRTMSASTMGSRRNIFEISPLLDHYSKESKQKVPVLSSYCPHGMLPSTNLDGHKPTKASSSNANANANAISLTQSEASSQALRLLHKFNKPPAFPSSSRNRSERKSVGLGVVAAFSDESRATARVKDGKDEAPPHVMSKNSTMQPVSFNFPHHSVGRSAVFLHELPCKDDYSDKTSMALPAADFLEACYFCKRRLSHGFDIYMYRGDQAFCSEECRYEQIVLDERKEKCLQALKMKTSALSFRSTYQRTQGMTSGTIAAG